MIIKTKYYIVFQLKTPKPQSLRIGLGFNIELTEFSIWVKNLNPNPLHIYVCIKRASKDTQQISNFKDFTIFNFICQVLNSILFFFFSLQFFLCFLRRRASPTSKISHPSVPLRISLPSSMIGCIMVMKYLQYSSILEFYKFIFFYERLTFYWQFEITFEDIGHS